MPKGELLRELGPPTSTLAAGPKELHHYGEGKTVEILNERVVALTGFDDRQIIQVKPTKEPETAKASTAYTDAPKRARRASEFVDFKTLEDAPKETFTLSSSKAQSPAENHRFERLLDVSPTTLYILGGGLAACLIIGLVANFSRSRTKVPLESPSVSKADPPLPTFLQSSPSEKPSLTDPRGDMSELREQRLAQRDDPDSMGLSIKASPYVDFDPSQPKIPLVTHANPAQPNPAYSSASNDASEPSKPSRKTRGPGPKPDETSEKRGSSLKLQSH